MSEETNSNVNIDDNTIDYTVNSAIDLTQITNGFVRNNKAYNINVNSNSTYMSVVRINNCTNIHASKNYGKKYSTANSLVYNLAGTISYLNIEENNNTSDVSIGIQMNALTELMTNSRINTNLSINGNYNDSYIKSSTNEFIQTNEAVVDGITNPYRYHFVKYAKLQNNSTRTLEKFEYANPKNLDIITLVIYSPASLTLADNTTDDFGITWKTTGVITGKHVYHLMFIDNKLYEI